MENDAYYDYHDPDLATSYHYEPGEMDEYGPPEWPADDE